MTLCADRTHPDACAVFSALLADAVSLRRLKACNRAGWRMTSGEPQGEPGDLPEMPELASPHLEALHLVSVPPSNPEEVGRYEDDGPRRSLGGSLGGTRRGWGVLFWGGAASAMGW